jgi:uroporphyrin-III C-methyltransferase/precorrin-2 dehydrogenase/sirohydrochlorin ferrochelatase
VDYLPVFLSLTDKDCLVVGGGAVACRKVDLLCKAGARVTVVAPRIEPALAEHARLGRIRHTRGVFDPAMLHGVALVVSATGNREVNRQVAAAAALQRLLVNVVDDPELCSFIFPAIVDRSPLIVAVSSGGRAPVLARLLKARVDAWLPPAYGRLADLAAGFRDRVKALLDTPEARRRFWERIFRGEVARLHLSGREQAAQHALEAALREESGAAPRRGSVTFFSIDPADAELLTLKALRHLQDADAIVHDPEVPVETLEAARRDAERISVGPSAGPATAPRKDVPALLVRLARQGRQIVRIRCAPPRAAPEPEETRALAAEGIAYRLLPAVSAQAP